MNRSAVFVSLFYRSCLKTRPLCRYYAKMLGDPENRGSMQSGVNFDTMGSWNNRMDMPLMLEESIKTGIPVPRVALDQVGVASVQGRRPQQEDQTIAEEIRSDLLCVGVLDGHGGKAAVEFVKEHLVDHIRFWCRTESNLEKALQQSFIDVNNAFSRYLHFKAKAEAYFSGTTATICLLDSSSRLVFGHVGDSGAILCRNGSARRLTSNHEPDIEEESKRISKCGGMVVTNSLGSLLVNGRLAMTRSIGDVELKSFGVIAKPAVGSIDIKHGRDAFLLLYSDGLSNAMNDHEMMNIISLCPVPNDAAHLLADTALQFGTDDNVTALVVPFGSWGKFTSPDAHFKMSLGRQLTRKYSRG